MRLALLQLNSSDDPAQNAAVVCDMMHEAAKVGADFVLTPEVTNCVSMDRQHQVATLRTEDQDETLRKLAQKAKSLGLWLSIGSLALKGGLDGRFVNRSFLMSPNGEIAARYDKMHMFDVTVGEGEIYRESAGYTPGDKAVLVPTSFAKIGLSICYDLRFPYLYRHLAQRGAEILLIPSAFSQVTGASHWEPLLRARAIETGCFVIAAAQTGVHNPTADRPRKTHGHSLVVSPWGEVLLDAGREPGVFTVDIDLCEVAQARARIPSLTHDRTFTEWTPKPKASP